MDENDRVRLAGLLLESCSDRNPGWWASIAPDVRRRLAAMDAGEPTLSREQIRIRIAERIRAARS